MTLDQLLAIPLVAVSGAYVLAEIIRNRTERRSR